MEEAIRTLNTWTKVMARRSKSTWDILLAIEGAAKALTGNILTTKTLRPQTGYMGTQMTWIILYRVPMYTTDDHLETFFSDYGSVEGVSFIKSKSEIATSDFEVLAALTQRRFNEIRIVITCDGRNIFVVVEGRRL